MPKLQLPRSFLISTDIRPSAYSSSTSPKLASFRNNVEQKHTCVYWQSAEELKAKVIVSLTAEVKRHPGVGWVRADQVPSESTLQELLTLRKRIAELEQAANDEVKRPPVGTEDLLQGDDTVAVKLELGTYDPRSTEHQTYSGTIEPTWDDIFAAIAPHLIDEQSEQLLRDEFREFFVKYGRDFLADDKNIKGKHIQRVKLADTQNVNTCLIQLRALGLITESARKRSVHDKGAYWKLTRFGDYRMVQLIALRHDKRHKASAIEQENVPSD